MFKKFVLKLKVCPNFLPLSPTQGSDWRVMSCDERSCQDMNTFQIWKGSCEWLLRYDFEKTLT